MKLIFDYKFRFYTSKMNEIWLQCHLLYFSSLYWVSDNVNGFISMNLKKIMLKIWKKFHLGLTVIYLDFILFWIIDKFSPVPIFMINNFVNKCWHHTYKWMSDKCTGCKILHNSNFFWRCKWFRQSKNILDNYFLSMLEFGTFKSC